MKVALVRNLSSQYSVIDHMERGLKDALERAGIGVEYVSLDEKSYGPLYRQCEEKEVECTLSINQVLGSSLFYDTCAVPHIFLSIDAVFWDFILDLMASHVCPCFPDQESIVYLKKMYQKDSFLFPHACALERAPYQVDRERPISFLLPASFIDEECEYVLWKERWGSLFAQQLVEEAESILHEWEKGFLERALTVYQNKIVPVIPEDTYEERISFLRSFERFVRGVDRARLLETLRGETVHVATNKESFLLYQKKHSQVSLVYEGPKTFDEVLGLFAQTECVLHTLPPSFRYALHERVLYALAFGCRLYATTMFSLPQWMRDGGIVSFYDQKDPLPRCRDHALFYKVWQWIEERHTWDVRVRELFPKLFQQVEGISSIGEL